MENYIYLIGVLFVLTHSAFAQDQLHPHEFVHIDECEQNQEEQDCKEPIDILRRNTEGTSFNVNADSLTKAQCQELYRMPVEEFVNPGVDVNSRIRIAFARAWIDCKGDDFEAVNLLEALRLQLHQIHADSGGGISMVVSTDGFIRSGKGIGEELVCVKKYTRVIALYEEDDYWRIRYSGHEGWIYRFYLNESTARVPTGADYEAANRPAEEQSVSSPKRSSARPAAPTRNSRSCCKICMTGKACGNSCIARNKTCRKGPGCACNG